MTSSQPSFGSLSGSLLARKGGAKPAMRPQAYRFDHGDNSAADDDCGWNDMGEDIGADMLTPEQRESLLPSADGTGAQPASVGAPRPEHAETHIRDTAHPQEDAADQPEAEHVPSVVEQQRQLADELAEKEKEAEQSAFLARLARESEPDDPLIVPEPVHAPKRVVQRAPAGSGPKSAFTLRLDKKRHLRLRLATAYAHKSAQKLVVEALDEYLSKHFPDLPA
ncbi:hypothetical protein KCG44_08180 [Pacificimonas sp. WHA3]|uniref:Chromosome partitioning protein ParB n=1 Tax=Pacificimonas pallii TaxID=2827236 RepID=A0ABS6SEC0_9SPHN|nr:hypothetical protein [Pacificimonas pallii]MBV7256763.1 hypothetical protein [Pacificimonas pallii]